MRKRATKSLSVRLPLLFVVSTILIMAVMIPVVYYRFHSRMIDQYTRMAQGVTQLMVNAIDGDKVDEYIQKNTDLPEYVDTVDYLTTLRDNYPDILYMYVYRFEEDGGHVIFDLDADWWVNGEGYPVGYVWSLDEMEEPFVSHLDEVMAGEQIAGYSELTKEDGYLFTYTRPIFRSDGSYACTACVDFSMDYLSGMDVAFTLRLSLLLLAIGAVVLVVDIHIVRRRVTHPIDELSRCANNFAYETEEDRQNNIQLVDALDIHTGDEIEDVYHMLQSVTHDSFDATASLSQALDDIRSRDGLITAMAADYRSVYYADLDKDECVCARATSQMPDRMWAGKTFPFQQGFAEYAQHCVCEQDREGFLRFIEPDSIRAGLAHETMLSYRYLAVINGVEQYEMLRIAGVRRIEEREDHIVHAIGVGFSNVDRETRDAMAQNRALTEALTRAEEANAAKTAFLSSMSHEIRTPMNAIIGLDNIALHDESISPEIRDDLVKIGSSARHLLSLINDILDMSRIESGRMQLKEEEFSFQEMMEQVNTIIHGQCEDKGLTYQSQVIGQTDEYFVGDDLRLRQVVINVLGNAVKFTDAPGTVTFAVEQTDGDDDSSRVLRFTMQDTGIGMDESFIPKLFEPFAQEDATTTNRYGGSGLGMALTKNMVDLMGGTIAVQSKKGQGTTFVVTVPLLRAHHVEETDASPEPESTAIVAGTHVLIVEDQEMNAEILAELLDMEEITSEWAQNGQIAVEVFQNSEPGHFDAVLMDMRMPVMDGLAATRAIRKLDHPDAERIPIIALTANAFEEDVRHCLEAGMDAHLSKPVDIDRLTDLMGRLLASRPSAL
ncbi:MAG: ATP-binding protein [Coriobacteriales bacterium]|nr:ATP-binding protein [Coriobacteriales bacterium]